MMHLSFSVVTIGKHCFSIISKEKSIYDIFRMQIGMGALVCLTNATFREKSVPRRSFPTIGNPLGDRQVCQIIGTRSLEVDEVQKFATHFGPNSFTRENTQRVANPIC